MISADTTIKEMYKLGLISVRAMNACLSWEINTLEQLIKTEPYELSKIKNCGRKTLMEFDSIRKRFYDCLRRNKSDEYIEEPIIVNTKLIEANKKLELLDPKNIVQFKSWIGWKYNALSTRSKNIFPQLNDLISVIDTIYCNEKFNEISIKSIKNCGKKTYSEIQSYLNEIKNHFEEITKNIDISSTVSQFSKVERQVVELGQEYPFLLTKECEAIIHFYNESNFFPYLFIAKQYIFRSEEYKMSIYRDFYGFNPQNIRYSLSEIGHKNNLSRERIRQLINKGIRLPKPLYDNIKEYLYSIIENVIPFDSSVWNKIQHENMLVESFTQTALLVCSLLDTYTIVQIEDDDINYLVNKNLIENIKLRTVLYNICRTIELRHTTIERIDILSYIKSEHRSYHKDIKHLCCIYANFLKQKYQVEIDDNRYIIILPNVLDISTAIENILEESRHPMSLDEIHDVFNTLYPSNAIKDSLKLKPYIFRNPNIKAKGKTGIYVLKSWKNHFTGTLTCYLEHILNMFGEPISLDDLVEFALDEFPKSNKRSIYSLIIGDKDGRFIVYEDNYIGLSCNSISNFDLKERRVFKRYSFDSRFNNFKQFVATRKRLPTQVGSDEEQSLGRWMVNVLKSNIESTDEQIDKLNKFLNENKSLPQNSIEYNFKQMCDQIKVIVTQSFELPNVTNNPSEYHWLRKNLDKYTSYEDNRKPYFEDLLIYLKDFGFYL